MSGNIFYLGNALYDICSLSDHSILQTYGLKADENCVATEKHNGLFARLLNDPKCTFSPGGSAQNSARFSQWLFSSWKKGQSTFVGSVGNDDLGHQLHQKLKSTFVNVIYDVNKTQPTGVTAALVFNDGTRTLCARLGAADNFNPEFLNSSHVQAAMNNADIIYVEGFFLSHNVSAAVNLARYAEKHSKYFAINLSGQYICEDYFDDLYLCVILSDLVIGNDNEAAAFIKKYEIPFSSAEDCARAIMSLPGKRHTVIITCASNPVIVANESSVNQFEVPKVEVVDTIGCGDAFVGGLLAGLSIQENLNKAVDCGIYCATLAATMSGCSLPDFDAKFEIMNVN